MKPGFTLLKFTSMLPSRIEVAPGVTMAPLGWTRPQNGGRPLPLAAWVWFEPGAELRDDHHGDSQEVNVILRGTLIHDGDVLGPDDVLICERGTKHSPRSPEDGPGAFLYVEFPDRQPGR